jgi:MFS family permease
VVAGVVSDHIDGRYLVAGGGAAMALAGLGFVFVPFTTGIIAFAIVFGIGLGAVFAAGSNLALASVPHLSEVGRDLGIWSSISGLPAIVAPAIGGWILKHQPSLEDGYRMLFFLASLSFILGSVSVFFVRKPAHPALP